MIAVPITIQLLHGGHRHRDRQFPSPGTAPAGLAGKPGHLGAVPGDRGLHRSGAGHEGVAGRPAPGKPQSPWPCWSRAWRGRGAGGGRDGPAYHAGGISRTLYGNYNGALNIYNLPTSLMAAVTAAVIPAVSGALARRDRRGAGRITGSALRITALVACPMAVGAVCAGKAHHGPDLPPSLNADLVEAPCCPHWVWPPCSCV